LGQLGQPERVITVAMMIKQVPDTCGQERQFTSVWLGFKASLLMTYLTLHDYRRDDSAAGSKLALLGLRYRVADYKTSQAAGRY